jgi:tetratricopeptide (TPR) repeat protein
MSRTHDILRAAVAVARERPADALQQLDVGLELARTANDDAGIRVLAKHAGVIAQNAGQEARALAYYEEALRHEPVEPLLHLAAGRMCEVLGDRTSADNHYRWAEQTAIAQGDDDLASAARKARNAVP